jgi:hypothetical protein
MFASWARGAEASTPPVRDAFQDVFANHLLARLNARNSAPGGTNRSLSRLGSTRKADTRWQPDNGRAAVCSQPRKEETARTASSSEEPRRISADRGKRLQELHKAQRRPKSQAAAAGLAADQNQPAAQSPQNQSGATAANPPQALQDLITFLQSFPGGSLKISPEQAPTPGSHPGCDRRRRPLE